MRRMTVLLVVSGSMLAGSAHAGPGDLLHRLLPDTGYDALQYGSDVSLKGGLGLIAGEGIFSTPTPGGAWLVDGATGVQLATFGQPVRPEGGDPVDAQFFGVGISGPIALPSGTAPVAVIGTVEIAPCNCYRDLVRVFDLADPTNPALLWTIRPDDYQYDDDFSRAIAIDGSVALIGAPSNDQNGALAGAAYLYDLTTGTQLSKLVASDGESLDQFGYSVDLDGGLAIIGARWESQVASRAGAAYLFDVSDPQHPVELAKLVPADGTEQDYFGWSVAIRGTVAAVGSIFDDDLGLDSGAVYTYDVSDPANPVFAAKVHNENGGANDDFGWAVALDGAGDGTITAAIGARTDDQVGPGEGSVSIYNLTDPASPVFAGKALPNPVTNNDVFGWSVALDGGVALIGAPGADDQGSSSGAAYFVDAALGPPPCNAADLAEPFGLLDLVDITTFVSTFTSMDPAGDLDGNGLFDLVDVTMFVGAFTAGCP
ncbi:MAG: FG-GAP repeat protein [Phycisphaeraceae bacterium]|nr:MAG: FG-GAP repeat protein [Phycisphaeraceae bacterium]